MTPAERLLLAREIVHYDHIPFHEAIEVMDYVQASGYPENHWLPALGQGGWATLYYNAWCYRTFNSREEVL